jgi:ferritin
MFTPQLQDALNEQINAEMWSAYLYLSMAMHFEAEGRSGIANWFNVQFREELAHAEIFRNYVNSRGGRVILKAIDAVPTSWATPLEAFKETLAHEQKVTSLINNLYALAESDRDYATRGRLDWFISEQVEEEDNARKLIDRLNLIGDNGLALYTLDQELSARTYVAPSILTTSED